MTSDVIFQPNVDRASSEAALQMSEPITSGVTAILVVEATVTIASRMAPIGMVVTSVTVTAIMISLVVVKTAESVTPQMILGIANRRETN